MKWYIDVMTNNYLNFNGRARRTEFWMFTLVHLIIIFLLLFLRIWPLLIIYFLLTVIPAVGVGIRRLHDTGRSGWWVLLANSPLLIIYYYFMILDGDSGGNIYGESPKESYMDRIMKDVDIENDIFTIKTLYNFNSTLDTLEEITYDSNMHVFHTFSRSGLISYEAILDSIQIVTFNSDGTGMSDSLFGRIVTNYIMTNSEVVID